MLRAAQEVDACRATVLRVLGELQRGLDPLWRVLSGVAGQVEEALRATKASEAAKARSTPPHLYPPYLYL